MSSWKPSPKAFAFTLAICMSSSVSAGSGYGQVNFQNNTNVTGDLYVDGNYGCGPVPMNLNCTTQIAAGAHTAYIKFADGQVVDFGEFALDEGQVQNLTVNMQQQQQ